MLRVALKKTRKKKVKKFAFDHCKTCSERFVIWRDNFSFIFQRKQELFLEANVDELKTLLEVALIQSTGASNRIEGISTGYVRV